MKIEHEENASGGRFVIRDAGEVVAEMTYVRSRAENVITIDHTHVDRRLEGRGIARSLVDDGVAWARKEGLAIVPACSYVRALFDKHEHYNDVRARG